MKILSLLSAKYGKRKDSQLPPLIVHVIYRLDVGGLENGLVNLINGIPEKQYRHAVICLTDFTDFRRRIESPNVPVIALQSEPEKTSVFTFACGGSCAASGQLSYTRETWEQWIWCSPPG